MRASNFSVKNALFVWGVLLSFTSFADVIEVNEDALVMNAELSKDTKNTLKYLRENHYLSTELNDDFSSRIFDKYLKVLDPNKLFFTIKDIQQFERYRFLLDEQLKQNDASVSFEIFKLFRHRVTERVKWVEQLIQQDFDFTKNEHIDIDNDKIVWAKDEATLKARWHQKIKNDFIVQIMSETEKDEIKKNLQRRYQRQRDVIFQLKAGEVFEWFINAYANGIGPHTQYMSHITAENFSINLSLSLQGIGAVLLVDDDYVKIQRTIPGGPAEQSGAIDPEDRIVAVTQDSEEKVNVIGWRLIDVVQMIRGDKGTSVTLDILKHDSPPGSPAQQVTIVRDVIKLEEQAAKLTTVDVGQKGQEKTVSVIRVPSFYSGAKAEKPGDPTSTTQDVKRLLKEVNAANSAGLVIDLRGNGGGYLNEAISLTGLFISQGPVVQVVPSTRQVNVLRDTDKSIAYAGPMVVLIDRYSASASEIFAGAMQDYGRAVIVGERSFGKGTVQTIAPLRGAFSAKHKSQLKFTIGQFFRINGESTQYKGVVPDVALNNGGVDEDFGERAYDNALPWAKTQHLKYNTHVFSPALFTALKTHHQNRSIGAPAFVYFRKNADKIRENKDIKTLSLNLEARKKQSDDLQKTALTQLNNYRAALGLEAVTKETKKDNPLPDEDEHWNIVYQKEAARILLDQLYWQTSQGIKNTAQH